MRERMKKFIALIMTVLVLNQLPGFESLVTLAKSIDEDTPVTADSEETYVFYSGGCTLTIDSGVTVAGVNTIGENTYTVQNGGTVNTVTTSSGTTNLNGGYYGNITVNEGTGSGVVGNSISAGTITAAGPIHLEGTNTVGTLISANDLAGTGTVNVTNELSIPGTSTTINVNRDTVISATNGDITVNCDGTSYTIPGGTTDTSILQEYGVYVSFQAESENISWEFASGTDNLDSYLWFGDTTGTYKIIAAEGYYFPDNYATKVVFGGSGSNTFDYISDTEVQLSYTVADTDAGEVIITLPTPNELEEGTGTLSIPDVYVGDTWEASVISSTNSIAHDGVMYKVKGTSDSTYTTVAPTSVGDYVARVILPKTGIYKELVLTDEFSINALPQTQGAGTLVVPDTYYGVAVKPQLTSTSNQTSGVVVEYKKYGTSDANYSKNVPTAVGKYVARAVLPENDSYKEIVLTDEFSIDYLPVPQDAYTLVGTVGSNGYYTSNVTVVAREGYALSDSLNGEYVEQLTIRNTTSSMNIYIMDEKTGAKTDKVALSVVNIDVDAPNIDAENNKTYYADSLAVSITDTNLASVLLNGENVEITGYSAVLNLKSDGGVEEYEIIVTDRAGNVRNMKVTVAAEWTKNGEIPVGSPVKLQAGKNYTLGEGSWTVSGDSTTYQGGSIFYVGGDGKFTFNKQ